MVKNLLIVIHVLEGLQQAEHLRMLNVYRLQSTKLATDSVRIRSWSGDSKNCCIWDFDAGSWHETCHSKVCSRLLLPEQKEHCAAVANDLIQTSTNEHKVGPKVPTWRELRCHCPMCNVSCVFFNKCLYFSYYMAGYFLDKPSYM